MGVSLMGAPTTTKKLKAITEPRLLLVEGNDEVKLFSRLIEFSGLYGFDVREVGGVTRFRPNLRVLSSFSGHENLRTLGVVRDADNDAGAAFQSVRDALWDAGLPVPDKPLETVGTNPRVSVMILPVGKDSGMLEDVCLASVAEDPALECVEDYFKCLKDRFRELPANPAKSAVRAFLVSREVLEDSHFQFLQQNLGASLQSMPHAPSSEIVHAFLASKAKPDLRLGMAAEAGYWDFNHRAFEQVKQFLGSM